MSSELLRAILAARTPTALAELRPYVPDPAPGTVRLDANEAPPLLPALDPRERALLLEALASVEPASYPDVRAHAVRAALTKKLDIAGDRILIGTGSDEVISILLSTLARGPAKVLVPSPSFVMYRISARVQGFEVIEVPLDRDWDLDLDRMLDAVVTHDPAVVFLATPNNPTAAAFSDHRVRALVAACTRGIVVVDEAYLPFRERVTMLGTDLLAEHANVVVLRTLSKIGLAALRVGYALAHPLLVAEMEKVRLPYDLPSHSQAAAACALGPLAGAIDRHVAAVVAERARLLGELAHLPRVHHGRTDANFVWLGLHGARSADAAAALKHKGILVRSFPAHGDRLRVTIGSRADDDRFLQALSEVLA